MEQREIKHVIEAALLAAGRPLSIERISELFGRRGAPDRSAIKDALAELEADYGYRIQVRSRMNDWLTPLWEERAPRYSRALLETLALIAYRQPITRGDIEDVRGVVVSTNIVRTLLERGWIRVVGHRDVPGQPAMFGTTKEFLDYFGLKKLDDLPPLSELTDLDELNPELGLPEMSPQSDLIDELAESPADVDESAEQDDAAAEVASADGNVVSLARPEPGL
jgi:segregation and condensation protein B